MVFVELTVAALVGGLAGLVGDRVLLGRHHLHRGVSVLAGIAAATGGTAAAQSVREEPLGPMLMVGAPLFFAGIALAVMATRLYRTGEPPRTER